MSQPLSVPANPRTILIRVSSIGEGYDEFRVAATKTVKPGHLIETVGVDANGAVTCQPHSTAGGFAEKRVAIEPAFTAEIPGETTLTTGGIDDSIPATGLVRSKVLRNGDEAYMWIAASQTILQTSFLTSNGDGSLKLAASTDQRLFHPKLAFTTTAAALHRVRAI